MDTSSGQQREMSIPFRHKEDTPSFVAGNTPRDPSPVRDITAAEWHAADPDAFQAAITIMNLSEEDRKLGKKDNGQEGMSLNTVP